MKAPRLRDGGPGLPRKSSPGFGPERQGAVAGRKRPQDSTSPSDAARTVGGSTSPPIKGGNQAGQAIPGTDVVERGGNDRKLSGRSESGTGSKSDPTTPTVRTGIRDPRGRGNAHRLEARRRKPRGNRAWESCLRALSQDGARRGRRQRPKPSVGSTDQAEEGVIGLTGGGHHRYQARLANGDCRRRRE